MTEERKEGMEERMKVTEEHTAEIGGGGQSVVHARRDNAAENRLYPT